MESSVSPAKVSDVPSHRWAKFFGTTIAFLTLAIPTLAIAYYSSATIPKTPPPVLPAAPEQPQAPG